MKYNIHGESGKEQRKYKNYELIFVSFLLPLYFIVLKHTTIGNTLLLTKILLEYRIILSFS